MLEVLAKLDKLSVGQFRVVYKQIGYLLTLFDLAFGD